MSYIRQILKAIQNKGLGVPFHKAKRDCLSQNSTAQADDWLFIK
jgi:hypothetical protein